MNSLAQRINKEDKKTAVHNERGRKGNRLPRDSCLVLPSYLEVCPLLSGALVRLLEVVEVCGRQGSSPAPSSIPIESRVVCDQTRVIVLDFFSGGCFTPPPWV